MKSLRIATWNIAGGRKIRSAQRFDYQDRDGGYFADQLRAINPDIVCLQEGEVGPGVDVARELADRLGMSYVFQTTMHHSHIDPKLTMTSAILSKGPLTNAHAVEQPYPRFELRLPNGSPDQHHLKYLQVAELRGVVIANAQTQPLEYLGTPYESERGQTYADELSHFFVEHLRRPLVFAGDFCADMHTKHVANIYKTMVDKLSLEDALPPGPTKPKHSGRPDAIFYSPELTTVDSGIIKTATDHFLCWAELSYTDVKEGEE